MKFIFELAFMGILIPLLVQAQITIDEPCGEYRSSLTFLFACQDNWLEEKFTYVKDVNNCLAIKLCSSDQRSNKYDTKQECENSCKPMTDIISK